MLSYANKTLKSYVNDLASQKPVPGGGSAAAYTAALGVGLISMVARFSMKRASPKEDRKKITFLLKKSEGIRLRLVKLVDLDAQAYGDVVKSRRAPIVVKKKALAKARKVPLEVCRLCYEALNLMPYLVKKGSPYLLNDLRVAAEFLLAAFNASLATAEVNR